MMVSVPSVALMTPPVTGASISEMLFVDSSSPSRFITPGELVDRSITTVPGFAFSATPPGPAITASTCFGVGSDSITTSLPAATSATLAPRLAPALMHASIAAGLRSNTVTSWLVLLTMLRDIGPPMAPTPMNPIFTTRSPCSVVGSELSIDWAAAVRGARRRR